MEIIGTFHNSSTRLSVLVNGSPSRQFSMGKGLHQGDRMPPLLYILVSEFLNLLVQRAKEVILLQGISLDNDMPISLLRFSDDTVFFLRNNSESII